MLRRESLRVSLTLLCALQSSWSVKSSRSEKSSRYNRKRASGARHTKCVHHIGYSSEAASGNMVNFFKVRVSRSSRSVKSSQLLKSSKYNRKRLSGARHTQCVHHIGCSSKAASGNVVKFFKVRASQSSQSVKSSWSEKSSRYNRKSKLSLPHECVHYMGSSSEAASGNVVKFHIGGDFTKKILMGSTRQFQKYVYVGVL